MADRIKKFAQFEPWRTAREWARSIYDTFRTKPEDRYFKVFERAHFAEKLQFYRVQWTSSGELLSLCAGMIAAGTISDPEHQTTLHFLTHTRRSLAGLFALPAHATQIPDGHLPTPGS